MAHVLTHDPVLDCPNPDIPWPDGLYLGPDESVTCGVCQATLALVDVPESPEQLPEGLDDNAADVGA